MTLHVETDIVRALQDSLGSRVAVDPGIRDRYRNDRSGAQLPGLPSAVVFAESTDDVATALQIANDRGVAVVTRGAGTGLAGGAAAGADSIVLSTERMTAILEVSRGDRIARVQAGVLTADIDSAARTVGLSYTPDPGSVQISTIGGNIATNAGGLRCVKYGVTKDSVLGVQVVLPDGRLLETGTRTVKGVTGLDLTSLFVGSEGVLGVITQATLRLRSVPSEISTVVGLFATATEAAEAVCAVLEAGESPTVAELLDATCLRALDQWKGTDFGAGGNALAMLQFDGADALRASRAGSRIFQTRALTVSGDDSGSGSGQLVAARRDALPALERLGRVLIEDVAVPPSALATMVERVEAIGLENDVVIATMAHAGDGNLHPIIVFEEPEIPEPVWRAADAIFTTALNLGGTLSGEHGVGLLKQRWLSRELGEVSADVMRGIKSVFDPNGIMNPGKAIPAGGQ